MAKRITIAVLIIAVLAGPFIWGQIIIGIVRGAVWLTGG